MAGSSHWWIAYSHGGKRFRESSGSDKKWKAQQLLKDRTRTLDTDEFVRPDARKRTVRDLFEPLRLDYANNQRKSWDDAAARWRLHLEPVFGNMRALSVTDFHIEQYKNRRKQEGAESATCNREISVLQKMYTIAKITKPRGFFSKFTENNVRKGFVGDQQYEALAAACQKHGLWLRSLLEAGYQLGWRISELLSMRVAQIDLAECAMRLDTSKNGESREAVMPMVLYELIRASVAGKAATDHVFTRNGKPVGDFRVAWRTVTTEAGLPRLLFHDLRRSAVRNMDRRGISTRGHANFRAQDCIGIQALSHRG